MAFRQSNWFHCVSNSRTSTSHRESRNAAQRQQFDAKQKIHESLPCVVEVLTEI